MFNKYDENLPYWNQMGYSLDVINRFWKKVHVIYYSNGNPDFNSCWEMSAGLRDGYPVFWVNGQSMLANRFVYECFNGPIEKGLCACHSCDNPKCVNPYHLWKGTSQQNTYDREIKGRSAKGSRISTSKLSEKDVEDILIGISNQSFRNISQICQIYNITRITLIRLLDGNAWSHLTKEICNKYDYSLKDLKSFVTDVENKENVKIDRSIVLKIVELYNSGYNQNNISELYNVSIATISSILSGKRWSGVTGINLKTDKRKGEFSKSSVLTEKQVSKIKEELRNGEKVCNLAKKYNVGNMTISRIKNKKCWTHV